MATETVENYLKAIYKLCHESPTGETGMTRLGVFVGVTTGTATAMVKKLAQAKLARYVRFGSVKLTPKGTKIAVDIVRRHRLIESFLVETLKLDWSVVHAEAERLEHAVSPVVLEALDVLLNHPAVDPHGDPIPDPGGHVPEPRSKLLSECSAGARVRIARVTDQDRAFLRFVARHGLQPGARVTVLAVDAAAQAITVQGDGVPVTLGLAAARKILAEHAPA